MSCVMVWGNIMTLGNTTNTYDYLEHRIVFVVLYVIHYVLLRLHEVYQCIWVVSDNIYVVFMCGVCSSAIYVYMLPCVANINRRI